MYYEIRVGKQEGFSLQQAVDLINAPDQIENLPAEQKQWAIPVVGNRHTLVLERDANISLGRDMLVVRSSVHIRGNNTVMTGTAAYAMLIMASDVTVEDLTMDSFPAAIMVDPFGMAIHDVKIIGCRFRNYIGSCILTGSSISKGSLQQLTIENCAFEGSPEMTVKGMDDWHGAPISIMLSAGRNSGEATLEHCLLEDVRIQNCKFCGRTRIGIDTIPAVMGEAKTNAKAIGNVIRGLSIDNCTFEGSYDATINIMGSFAGNVDSLTENITITNCNLLYNIWGIYFCATEPCDGTAENVIVRNIEVAHNTLTLREGGSGEDSAALAIQCGRLDYAEGAKANYGIVENVVLKDNTIHHTQHGIFLNAADSMVDAMNAEMIGNEIRHVRIEGNRLYEVDDCFTFYGVQAEGRRVDVRLGIPPRTMIWLPLLTEHDVTTITAKDNVIWDVLCCDNYATGHKFMYKIAGVKAAGHAYVEGNRVAEDVILENNTFENGENHILVEEMVLCDWVQGKNNTVPKRYR